MTAVRGPVLRRLALATVLVATAATAFAAPHAAAARASLATGVVEIQTRLSYASGTGAATGMVLTSSGKVLTNNHVIRGAQQIRVRVPQNGRVFGARVLGYDVVDDVALLELNGASGLKTVSLGNSANLKLGQKITAVGNAGGNGVATVAGRVTGLGRTITVSDEQGGPARLAHLIKTDADLRPGDSGGPMLDAAGRVIGMNAAASAELVFRAGGGDGYAIPVNRATAIARQIEEGRSSANVHIGATPFLGVTIADSDPGAPARVLVAGVRSGSPAARAGIAAGDVIVAIAGHTVRTRTGLISFLLRKSPGDRISVAWIDGLGWRHAAKITLASGPPQ